MTFNFWHKLSEELYQRNKTDLNDIFKPYVQRLIIALCSHCQMDPDHVSAMSISLVSPLTSRGETYISAPDKKG